MKRDRRILSSSLSGEVIDYLRKRGRSQVKIADLLGVSEAFVSLVKSRERSLTLDHIERLCERLKIPMGALFQAVTPLPKGASQELKDFFALSSAIMDKATEAQRAILKVTTSSPRQ